MKQFLIFDDDMTFIKILEVRSLKQLENYQNYLELTENTKNQLIKEVEKLK